LGCISQHEELGFNLYLQDCEKVSNLNYKQSILIENTKGAILQQYTETHL